MRDERGSVLSVEFLIVSVLVFFLAFGAVDYWLIQVKAQQAEHVKNYYLDRIRVEGVLTDSDRNDMIDTLNRAGFELVEIDTNPVRLRNVEDINQSEVWLKLGLRPMTEPFLMGRILGLGGDGNFVIRVAGRGLSERVE